MAWRAWMEEEEEEEEADCPTLKRIRCDSDDNVIIFRNEAFVK